jgi:hypothetical protein
MSEYFGSTKGPDDDDIFMRLERFVFRLALFVMFLLGVYKVLRLEVIGLP